MRFTHFPTIAAKPLVCLALFLGLLALCGTDPTVAVAQEVQKPLRPSTGGFGIGGRPLSPVLPIHSQVGRSLTGPAHALSLPERIPDGASAAATGGGAIGSDAIVRSSADGKEPALQHPAPADALAPDIPRAPPRSISLTLLPADLVQADVSVLRAGFAAEVADAGLIVLDDVDFARISDVVNKISLAAYAPEFGPGYSGRFFQRRDFLVVGTRVGATTTIATFDVIVARDANQLTVRLVRRFDPGIDRVAGGPTGLGGMVIEQLAVATIDNFEAALQTIALAKDPAEAANLLSSTGSLTVGDIDQRFRVTNSLGESITYAPGEMTLRWAMSQLGGSCTPFWNCVWDCMVADGFLPDPTLVLCLVDAVLWCLPSWAYPPAGATCTASYLVVICGFQYLISELLDLVFCAWGCYFTETSILVEITALFPNPVEPNAPVFIAGIAQYDNCDVVEAATAHIYLASWSGTASVVNGYFSRTIYAPSSEGNYVVTVVVVDGQHQGTNTAVLQVQEENSSPPGCGYELKPTWVIYDFDEPTNQWWSKDCFRTTDEFVNGLFHVNNLSCPVTLKLRFFYPDGSQYGQDLVWAFNDPVPPPNWYWFTWGYLINGNAMSYVLGRYHVKMYIDSGQGFQLVGNKPYVVGWEFAEGLLSRNVNPNDPYDPTGITDFFYQNDPQMYTWTKVESVAQDTELRCRFYEPNGGSPYYEVNGINAPGYDITGPLGPHDCFGWYKSWASIGISGYAAAQKCGPWTTHVEYQNPTSGVWQTLYQDTFQILEAPNVLPTVSADASPSDPLEGEAITLSASANDNTYLDRLELYWSDGEWHQVTLGDDIFAGRFSSNYMIGSFPAGQTIEFYAVAVDTSGNASVTDTQAIIVQPLCGNGVIDPGEDCENCQADVQCPPGTVCANAVCQPVGACCFENGACTVVTSGHCNTLGGSYQGDGISCSPNPCPQPPTGACCFDNGSCTVETSGICNALGGSYQGNGSNCSPNNCPGPPADFTGPVGGVPDGCVDAFDLGAMLGAWCSAVNDPNPPSPPCENCDPGQLAFADISGAANVPDGCIDAFDLAKLLAEWCSVAGGNPCGTCQ